MGVWDKLEDAEVSDRGAFFKPGLYSTKISAIKLQQSKVDDRLWFVIEAEILSSNNEEEYPVGSHAAQLINLSNKMGLPNVKKFLAAVVGASPTLSNEGVNKIIVDTFTKACRKPMDMKAIAEYISGDENPLADTELNLECVQITTKKGNPFTLHNWSTP